MQNRYIKQKNSASVPEYSCLGQDNEDRFTRDRDAIGHYEAVESAQARIPEEDFGTMTHHDGQVIIIL